MAQKKPAPGTETYDSGKGKVVYTPSNGGKKTAINHLKIQDEIDQHFANARAVANLLMVADRHTGEEIGDDTIGDAAFFVFMEIRAIEDKLNMLRGNGEGG